MKRDLFRRMGCVFVLAMSVLSASGKAPFVSDYVYVGGGGGYAALVGSTTNMHVVGGGTGGLNVGYELRIGKFLLNAGVSAAVFNSNCNTDLQFADVHIMDTRLGDAVMHYKMNSPLWDYLLWGIYSVGLMAGYSMNNYANTQIHGGWYVLGGVRFAVKQDYENKVGLSYRTSATYERYIDDYEGMDNHYYTDYETERRVDFGVKLMGIAQLETGVEFNLSYYDKLKLGAYLDWGFTNVMQGVGRSDCYVNVDNASEIVVDSYYKSTAMKERYVTTVMTGLRLTYSFNVNRKRNCISKDCNVGYRR